MTIGSLLTYFFACALLASPIAFAEDYAEIERLAAEATKQLIQLNPRRAMLLQKSAGILVFPRVTKGGVVVAGDAFASGVLL